jgi:hypothetical protein
MNSIILRGHKEVRRNFHDMNHKSCSILEQNSPHEWVRTNFYDKNGSAIRPLIQRKKTSLPDFFLTGLTAGFRSASPGRAEPVSSSFQIGTPTEPWSASASAQILRSCG